MLGELGHLCRDVQPLAYKYVYLSLNLIEQFSSMVSELRYWV
jgi:hypothetical protein